MRPILWLSVIVLMALPWSGRAYGHDAWGSRIVIVSPRDLGEVATLPRILRPRPVARDSSIVVVPPGSSVIVVPPPRSKPRFSLRFGTQDRFLVVRRPGFGHPRPLIVPSLRLRLGTFGGW